jgi:hypothetical protein
MHDLKFDEAGNYDPAYHKLADAVQTDAVREVAVAFVKNLNRAAGILVSSTMFVEWGWAMATISARSTFKVLVTVYRPEFCQARALAIAGNVPADGAADAES